MENILCSYGCNKPAKFKLKNEKYCCESSYNKCPELKRKNSEKIKELHKLGICKIGWNKEKSKWRLYKSKEELNIIYNKQANTLLLNQKLGITKTSFKNKHHTKESKEKISLHASCHSIYCKQFSIFNSYENKEVKVQGTWEFAYANYLNQNNIKWTKTRKNNLKYKLYNEDYFHTYYPDFYLIDTNEYIEIKGYYSDKNKNKMQKVLEYNPNIKLSILFKEDLLKLNIKI